MRHNQLRQRCDVQKLVKVGVFQCLLAGGFVLFAGGVQLCLPCLQLGQTVGDLVLAQAQLRLAAAEQQLACQRPQRGVQRVLHQPLQRGLQLGALLVQRLQLRVQLVNFCVEIGDGGSGVLLLLFQRQRGGKRRQVQLLFGQGGQVGAVVVFNVGAQSGGSVAAGGLQRGALGGVRLRLFPSGGQRVGGVLRGVFRHDCQPLGVQLLVHRHADAGQPVRIHLEVVQLLLQFLQLCARLGDLTGQFGNLLVNFLYGVLQLGGHAVLLGGQLLLARLYLFLRVLQLFFGGVQLRLALVQLCLGICQTVADLHQQLVVDFVDLVLVQRDLHGLFHKPGRGNTRHTVHAPQLWQQGVFDIIGQFVDVHIVTADRNVLRGKHIGRHFDQHRGRAYAGQRVAQLVQRRAGLDHGAVHIGVVLVLQGDKAVVFVALADNVFNAVQRGKAVLDGLGDLSLDLLGAGAGIGGDDHQVRQVHIGQQVGLHPAEADKPQHNDQNDRHQHGKRLFNAEFRHIVSPLGDKLEAVFSRPTGRSAVQV